MILVISHEKDEHATAVLAELNRLGAPATLFDMAHFPQQFQIALRYTNTGTDGPARAFDLLPRAGETPLPLSECRAIWWRRPMPFEIDDAVRTASHRNFAYNECLEAVSGLWQTLAAGDAFWINPPARDEVAARKAYQLRVAQDVGLPIPDTLITNSPDRVREFIRAQGGPERTIYKSFSATEEAWRETRLLKENEVALLDAVRFAPVIFQEYIPARVDLRITVIGPHVFPGAIHSQETAYAVDFRMDMNRARVEPWELPGEVERGLHALMERLGLVYGAIDMRLTPDGRYVFLEVNPAGQWLFMEEHTRHPITQTLARTLAENDQPR